MSKDREPPSQSSLVERAKKEGIDRFVVGGVVNNNERVLLLKRKIDDFMGGIFELPSGKVNKGESLSSALKREILEETNLQVIGAVTLIDTFDYESKSGKKTRQFNYSVDVEPGQVMLSPTEHEDFQWITEKELGKVNVTDSVRTTLERYWKDRNARKD